MRDDNDTWAQESLRDIALEGVRERRRARRWGIFFKLIVLGYLIAISIAALRPVLGLGEGSATSAHTAVIRIQGPIMADSPASAERVIAGLERAFAAPQAQGILLDINSPGGSPVESSRIYQAIQRLRAANPDQPVHAVAGDSMASGAYYIAAAADQIHVDGASVVGSIGVITRSFNLSGALERLGIERRIYSAGEQKAGLDPFTDADPASVAQLETMLNDIHEQFISAVQQGRGERLTGESQALFSGRIWSGRQAIDNGLADALGTPRGVARDVIGAAQTIDYTPQQQWLDRAIDRLGASAVRAWIELNATIH